MGFILRHNNIMSTRQDFMLTTEQSIRIFCMAGGLQRVFSCRRKILIG